MKMRYKIGKMATPKPNSERTYLLRQAWIKSGAYRTVPFKVWYHKQVEDTVLPWFLKEQAM